MAKRFLTPLNLPNLASDPEFGTEGDLYFNTISNSIKIYVNDEWQDVTGGGGAAISVSASVPLTAQIGDAWFETDSGSLYVYDGEFWVEAAFTGTVGEGGGVSNETIRDVSASLLDHELHNNLTVFYDDPNDKIILTALQDVLSVNGASGNVILTTSEIEEGTNLYFTNQRAIDAASATYILQTDQQSIINSASAAAVSSANSYTDGEVATLEGTISSASAQAISDANSYTDSEVDLALSAATGYTDAEVLSASSSIINYTQQTYLPFTGGTIDGDLQLTGNFSISGSTVYVNAQDLSVADPIIYLGANASGIYISDLLDTGFLSAYGPHPEGGSAHYHRGLVFDHTDDKWKLISDVPHPEDNFVDFSEAVYETLLLGNIEVDTITATGTVSASAFIGDGSQLTGIVSLPDQTGNEGKYLTTDGTDAFWDVLDLSLYLTLSSASATYLTQSSASSTYLTQADATSTYLTQIDASIIYLTQSSASTTYAVTARGLPTGGNSGQYLVKSSGSDFAVTWGTINTPDEQPHSFLSMGG